MNIADWMIAPGVLMAEAQAWRPLGLVDLDRCPHAAVRPSKPAFPLIGLGDPGHPMADALDTVVEPPISAEAIVRQILRAPKAAAAAMHLLRSIQGLEVEAALFLESICYGMLQASAEHLAWLEARPSGVQPAPVGELRLERRGAVLQLVLDRPSARNAIDRSLRDALYEAFTLAALDPDIRSIRLSAEGPTFSVGAELCEFGVTSDAATAHLIRARTLPAFALSPCADKLQAHVRGGCVGSGLEMAAFARQITASRTAWFQLPELAMGLIPGAGGCVSVPRRIGRQRTALMILSGRRINATVALGWGLIDKIIDTPPGDEGGADQR